MQEMVARIAFQSGPCVFCKRRYPSIRTGSALQKTTTCPPFTTALYPRHRHLSAKVRFFIELLEQRLGDNPHWDLVD